MFFMYIGNHDVSQIDKIFWFVSGNGFMGHKGRNTANCLLSSKIEIEIVSF